MPILNNFNLFMTDANQISYEQFAAVDIRVGTVLRAEEFPEARIPAYKLFIDFGAGIGEKQSSAQITDNYTLEELVGRQVLAVVNFPAKQVGPFMSEVLTLGHENDDGTIILVAPDAPTPNGARLL